MDRLIPFMGAIKAGAIVALLIGVFWLGHGNGAKGVQANWDSAELARANAETAAVLARVAQNKETFIQQERTNAAITQKHNDELDQVRAAVNRAGGLRPGKALCGGVAASAIAKSAGISDAADTGSGMVSADTQRDIDAMIMQVEEAMSTGRACQAFVIANGLR